MNKNIILIGRGTIAVNCLNILYKKKLFPKLVICDVLDQGVDTWTKSLFKRAKELGYIEEKNLFRQREVSKPDFINKIKKSCSYIDIIFSLQPYAIFKKNFIKLARDYIINLHFAPLPKLRGVAPCSWAILDDLKKMGVTLHLIQDEEIDNGPIIFQKLFPITDNDNAWTLFNKCIKYGTELFRERIEMILNNKIVPIPQDEKKATYHSKKESIFNNNEINLNKDVKEVFNFIRSRIFPPYQLPYFYYKDKIKKYVYFVKKIFNRNFKNKKEKIIFENGSYYLNFGNYLLHVKVEDKFLLKK